MTTATAVTPDTGDTEPVSWAPEVLVRKKWSANSLRFATKKEAER